MCGIAGGNLYSEDTIRAALDQLSHRGKDASHATSSGGVWMGHNRLAIQDLSSGADQPLEDGEASMVFNGELWRRTILLFDSYKRLESGLLRLVSELDGMFAVAVHDKPRQQIVLARDWLGRIPLYYVVVGKSIAFASEAKALKMTIDCGFAGNGQRAQTKSEIKLFPPGCVGVYSLATGRLDVKPFRNFDEYRCGAEEEDRGAEHYARGIREGLEAAVANESISDAPVCTILSGGIDSTLVTALLARVVPDLRAYTVSVGESNGKDDLHFARRAAEAIGIPLTEVIMSPDEVAAGIEEGVWAAEDDRWVQVAPAIPQIKMARRIGADGYKVVFGGEGSDELFASYGDVRRWSWQPHQYRDRRVKLCERLHDNNLIRGNKAMMWGGTVELRTPFLDRELVDFCLRIPARYRSNDDGKGSVMKPLLREAFRGMIPDDLLMRKKVTFQEGAHSDFLKGRKDEIADTFRRLFN